MSSPSQPPWSGRALPPGASFDGSPSHPHRARTTPTPAQPALAPEPAFRPSPPPTSIVYNRPTVMQTESVQPRRPGAELAPQLGSGSGAPVLLGPIPSGALGSAVGSIMRPSLSTGPMAADKSAEQEVLGTAEGNEQDNSSTTPRPHKPALSVQTSSTSTPITIHQHHLQQDHARASTIPFTATPTSLSPSDMGPYPVMALASPAAQRDSYVQGYGGGPKGRASQTDDTQFAQRPPQPQQQDTRPSHQPPRSPAEARRSPLPDRDMAGIGRASMATRPAEAQFLGSLGPTGQLRPATPSAFRPPSGQPPPHLVQQPEVCVECMMRDRDMADVDVTGHGMWERESDAEFEEVMRAEQEGEYGSASEESSGMRHGSLGAPGRSREGASVSRESLGRSSVGPAMSHSGRATKGRLGRGQGLTSPNLKLWTNMNPPASAHRWKTLQVYLRQQNHILDQERHARQTSEADKARHDARASHDGRPVASLLPTGRGRSKSQVLANGLTVERIDVSEDERAARVRAKSGDRLREAHLAAGSPIPASARTSIGSLLATPGGPYPLNAPLQPPAMPGASASASVGAGTGIGAVPMASPSASVRSYTYGDQPWLASEGRPFSSPQVKEDLNVQYVTLPPPSPSAAPRSAGLGFFGRSSSDLRSVHSPRSMSPGGNSLGVDERRGSVWSRFRQSASQSVLSFAPSGSMMDMHLGLSQDKHHAREDQLFPNDPYRGASDSMLGGQFGGQRQRATSAQARGPAEAGAFAQASPEEDNVGEGEGEADGKKKKKGIKKLLGKVFGGDKKGRARANTTVATSSFQYEHDPLRQNPGQGYDRDDGPDFPLAPPPPISALVNDPAYHTRSASNSSVDSFQGPHTPPVGSVPSLAGMRRGSAGARLDPNFDYYPRAGSGGAADRGSILTTGSYASGSSRSRQVAARAARRSRQSAESLAEANGPMPLRTASPELYLSAPRGGMGAGVGAGGADQASGRSADGTTEVLSGTQDDQFPTARQHDSHYQQQQQQRTSDSTAVPQDAHLPAEFYQHPASHRSASAFGSTPDPGSRATSSDAARARARSVYSLNAPSLSAPSGRPSFTTTVSATSDWDELGAGAGSVGSRKGKFLGGKGGKLMGGWGKKKAAAPEVVIAGADGEGATVVRETALGAIEREGGLVSVRY